MNQIQLIRNMNIRIFFGNEKYNSIWKKRRTFGLLFLLIALGFFMLIISTNKSPNNNFNNASCLINSDTIQKSSKTGTQNKDVDPLVAYGDLLKDIESRQEEKNTLSISIESSNARITEMLLKSPVVANIKDTTSGNHKSDSILKIDETKKIYDQKRKQTEIDSIKSKIVYYNSKIKQIEDTIKKLESQKPSIIANVQKKEDETIDQLLAAQNGQGKFLFKGTKYFMCVVDMQSKAQSINFHLKNKEGKSYNSIAALLKDKELDSLDFIMVTNGGMYTPNHEPQGLFIEKGKTIKPLDESDINNNTNFYLFPNGVFYVDSTSNANIKKTPDYSKDSKKLHVKYATQSGPMLVIDNKIHDKFVQGSKNTNIRSGVGIREDKKVVFIISDDYVNFWDFATVFKDVFGCKNALYLDGAISLMYLKTVNHDEVGGNFGPLISVTKRKQ